jgi:hypothetical protein
MGEVVQNEVCLWELCVPEATAQAAALLVVGVLTCWCWSGLAHVYDARDALDEERERLVAERDAFRRFAATVKGLDASTSGITASTDAPVAVRTKPPNSEMGTVREAYRGTVMGVSHFDDEYGEELVTNAAAELSSEVAAALADDGPLTPQFRGALVTQSREAAASRENHIAVINGEREDFSVATERLERVKSEVAELDEDAFLPYTYGELEDAHDRLASYRADCEGVIDERQADLHADGAGAQGMDGHGFCPYMYGDLDVRYPVLADAANLIDRIEAVESRVVRSLLRRA